jgi:membrane-bound lytic murein transglycosylase D
MCLSKAAVCGVILLSLLTEITFGQSASEQQSRADVQAIIDRAEESFRRGEEAIDKGQIEVARRLFDQAVDVILLSGVELRANPKLDSYYRDLIERIRQREVVFGEQRQEVTTPSLLDELSNIDEAELAATTPDGIKIYGKYDFEFSVAPPVFQFINFFVAGRGRSSMEIGLQRSGRYRQMVEKIFKEERVPLDLIWLAQAESVWRPNALSRAAARGIWQFVPSTGLRFGLAQTAWVDERSNPEKSTRAAARYLKSLHEHFAGDWLLAMAAYNAGESRVDEAISRCGYADFWELHRRGLLPGETRNYVPIILSIIIISKNQKRYGFNVKPDPPLNFDTFELPSQTDLKVVADLLGLPYEVIQELNPELRRGISPPDQRYTIRLPKGTKRAFEQAYASLSEDQRVRRAWVSHELVEVYRPTYRTQLVAYRAHRGDTLQALSRRYGVSVYELARLNRMPIASSLRKGQTIKVPVKSAARARSRGSRRRR